MKTKYLLALVVGVVVLSGVFYLVTKNNKTPAPVASSDVQEETVTENSIYEHVHSVFKIPDGTILMGAHTGLFKSTDGGKTFARTQIKSADSSVNADGEFMNFAYDSANKEYWNCNHFYHSYHYLTRPKTLIF